MSSNTLTSEMKREEIVLQSSNMKSKSFTPFERTSIEELNNKILCEEQIVSEEKTVSEEKIIREELVNQVDQITCVEDDEIIKVFRRHAVSKIDNSALKRLPEFDKTGKL